MVILTLDLGTSVTKADLWAPEGRLASGHVELTTTHPGAGRHEQDPTQWWPAVVAACGLARRSSPDAWAAVAAIGFAAARQTVVATRDDGTAVGPALLWSDRRADIEADELSRRLGGDAAAVGRTGQALRGTSVAAKLAWLVAHQPEVADQARWILSPRDWLVWRLTGRVATDPSLASASGCYDRAGSPVADLLSGTWADRLPEVIASASVAGGLRGPEADDLGLAADLPVVIGAGDRACEVLGSGATRTAPVVSWGTAANLSAPGWSAAEPVPPGLVASCMAVADPAAAPWDDRWQVEGGISSAGSLLAWLSRLTGQPVDALVAAAGDVDPGAGGIVALPWLDGARAPWWDDDAGAALLGLRADTEPAQLTRAALEGVGFEVARILARLEADRAIDGGGSGAPGAGAGLRLTGRGSDTEVWMEVVAGVTGRPVTRRSSGRAAAVGAAQLTAAALGQDWSVDRLDPVTRSIHPDPEVVERYQGLAPAADDLARAVLGRTADRR